MRTWAERPNAGPYVGEKKTSARFVTEKKKQNLGFRMYCLALRGSDDDDPLTVAAAAEASKPFVDLS